MKLSEKLKEALQRFDRHKEVYQDNCIQPRVAQLLYDMVKIMADVMEADGE